MYYDNRRGCLTGLFELFALNWIFDWAQRNFGFGRGGCSGCGCGIIMLVIFVLIAASIICNTNWGRLSEIVTLLPV